jgi:hypothetical protein
LESANIINKRRELLAQEVQKRKLSRMSSGTSKHMLYGNKMNFWVSEYLNGLPSKRMSGGGTSSSIILKIN